MFFWFVIRFFLNFLKSIINCSVFLSFQGINHAYLLKISITHNKKRIPLLSLLINCISARSAPHVLSMKGECTFLYSNFQVIGLCNSPANHLFEIFSFLPADFFCKHSGTICCVFIKTFMNH